MSTIIGLVSTFRLPLQYVPDFILIIELSATKIEPLSMITPSSIISFELSSTTIETFSPTSACFI